MVAEEVRFVYSADSSVVWKLQAQGLHLIVPVKGQDSSFSEELLERPVNPMQKAHQLSPAAELRKSLQMLQLSQWLQASELMLEGSQRLTVVEQLEMVVKQVEM